MPQVLKIVLQAARDLKAGPAFKILFFLAQGYLPAILANLLMASFFLITWFSPYTFGQSAPRDCGVILIAEALFVLAAPVIIASRAGGALRFLALFPLVFATALVFAVDATLVPMAFFAWHCISSGLLGWGSDADTEGEDNRWAVGVTLYMVSFFAASWAVAHLHLPEMGWQGQPIVPAWGVIYFSGLAICEFLLWGLWWWKKRRKLRGSSPMRFPRRDPRRLPG